MINHFDEVMRRPLTIGDVFHLVKKVVSSPNERPDYSSLTWQEIFDTFDVKTQLEMYSIAEQYRNFQVTLWHVIWSAKSNDYPRARVIARTIGPGSGAGATF